MSNHSKKARQTKARKAGSMAFAITFVLYLLFSHGGGLIVGLIVAGLVSSIVRSMAPGLDLKANNNQSKERKARQAMPVAAPPVEKTGNTEVDTLLDKGQKYIERIREENLKIPDALLTDKLAQLEILCGEIFRTVHDKPEKAPQIRKFMEYYLPTTLKIVSTYRVISERGIGGSEIIEARQRIDDALGTVIKGCQKLLNKLYQDDVLDITTDIDVLEQMLKRDGLTETELQMAADQARRAAEINAAVDQRAQAAAPQAQQQAATVSNGSQAQQIEG
ncbi:MAG TPA: 5-bromo-4-chloroindolyl phosphate hydrolysis family protein [Candidatus Limiplasma sp.]|nr:5-bromo-4-chloroindolyl phosphate hydrolysis family protein [Candidatus Limiplasma sp.]